MADKEIKDFSAVAFADLVGADLFLVQTDVSVTRAYKSLTTTQLTTGVQALVNATSLTALAGTLSVAKGGTGAVTLTGLLMGNGTGAFTGASAGTDYVSPTGVETLTNKTLTSPTLTTPDLGVATATSINGSSIPTSKTLVVTTDKLSVHAATSSAELAGVISDETGSGALVFATSPTLVTPVLGVASATSINGSTIPTSKTLVVTTDKLSVHAATSSAELAGVISDETGSGALVFATSPTLVTPNVGVATATSVNKVAITAPATSATLAIADGKTLTASNTLTFAGTDSTTLTFQATGTVVNRDSTDTLTNKRITLRIATLTDAATVTPATDSFDGGILTTLSQATQLLNPTGTPTDGQKYTLRIKSTTSRALTYDTQYRGSADMALPTATSGGSLTDYFVFQRNAADSKWDLLGRNFGF